MQVNKDIRDFGETCIQPKRFDSWWNPRGYRFVDGVLVLENPTT